MAMRKKYKLLHDFYLVDGNQVNVGTVGEKSKLDDYHYIFRTANKYVVVGIKDILVEHCPDMFELVEDSSEEKKIENLQFRETSLKSHTPITDTVFVLVRKVDEIIDWINSQKDK